MTKLKKNLIIFFICVNILNFFIGCEKPQEKVKPGPPQIKSIDLEKLGGMFIESNDVKKIKLCGKDSEILISEESDFKKLDSSFPGLRQRNQGKRFYAEVEGFRSVKENLKSKNFDTIFVITNVIQIDTVFDCSK